jgi:hypothetical protein
MKIMKTVYKQEVNKIIKCKKSGAGTNDLYKPKLVGLTFSGDFMEFSSSEANSFISVDILDAPS